jgi:hypothetical protein
MLRHMLPFQVHFSGRAQCQRPHPCCLVRQAAGNSAPIGVTKAMAGPLAHQHTQWTDEELLQAPLPQLMAQAAELRDSAHHHITFSPKVFIPLTRLCRDTCSYCTFALPPSPGRRAFMVGPPCMVDAVHHWCIRCKVLRVKTCGWRTCAAICTCSCVCIDIRGGVEHCSAWSSSGVRRGAVHTG